MSPLALAPPPKEFYCKVFAFLKRHELELEEDNEYSEVMEKLGEFLDLNKNPDHQD